MKHYIYEWARKRKTLNEADMPAFGGQPDPAAGGPPTTDPNAGGLGDMGNPMPSDPNAAGTADPNAGQGPAPVDISNDPQTPDMPEEKPHTDFEQWKNKYFKEAITSDTNKMMGLINDVRDKQGLEPYQRKFVEDNWNIQLIREISNVDKASKEIRKLLKEQLDRNNPATSVVNHVTSVLETMPMLNNIYIKLSGYSGLKGDLHRKYVSALLGAVQVGSGANTEDIIYNEREYSIMVSTRINSRWGDVVLGSWTLREDDPQRYLSDAEQKRLNNGSPEERDVLRRRVVMESIAKQFETRAFVVNVVGEDGTIYHLGWDIANSLRSAYSDGKIVVKSRISDTSEAMIDDEGNIIPLIDLDLFYMKETGQQGDDGLPEKEHIEFMERKNGTLFLSATLQTIKEAATALPGMVFKEVPYQGNPSDLQTIQRCVYSAHDLIVRKC